MYNLSVECRFIGAANIGRAIIFLLILIELDNLWIWTAHCRHLMTFNQNTKLHLKTLGFFYCDGSIKKNLHNHQFVARLS